MTQNPHFSISHSSYGSWVHFLENVMPSGLHDRLYWVLILQRDKTELIMTHLSFTQTHFLLHFIDNDKWKGNYMAHGCFTRETINSLFMFDICRDKYHIWQVQLHLPRISLVFPLRCASSGKWYLTAVKISLYSWYFQLIQLFQGMKSGANNMTHFPFFVTTAIPTTG